MRVCSSTAPASYTSFGFGCLLFDAMLPLLTLCCRFSLDLFAKRACRRNCFLQHALCCQKCPPRQDRPSRRREGFSHGGEVPFSRQCRSRGSALPEAEMSARGGSVVAVLSISAFRGRAPFSRGGATPAHTSPRGAWAFQSTLPARGATSIPAFVQMSTIDFNPRAPRGERLRHTHRPGERRPPSLWRLRSAAFQSARPARGSFFSWRRSALLAAEMPAYGEGIVAVISTSAFRGRAPFAAPYPISLRTSWASASPRARCEAASMCTPSTGEGSATVAASKNAAFCACATWR